ncbi:hypothetical protein GCM10023087_12730 [Microbacterium rhizosphaerae]
MEFGGLVLRPTRELHQRGVDLDRAESHYDAGARMFDRGAVQPANLAEVICSAEQREEQPYVASTAGRGDVQAVPRRADLMQVDRAPREIQTFTPQVNDS